MKLELAGYRIMKLNYDGFHRVPGEGILHAEIPEELRKWELCSIAVGQELLELQARLTLSDPMAKVERRAIATSIIEPVYAQVK